MPTKTLVLPSGLTGEVRNLKAKEMSILADPANAQQARTSKRRQRDGEKASKRAHPLDPIYSGCWLKTIDPGPYPISEGMAVPWSKVLQCDRFYLLLQIRDLTWGAYEFKVKCQTADCGRAKNGFLWEMDLNELAFKELPAASRDKVKAGDLTFDITIGGRACKYRLMTGEDEANLPTLPDDVAGPKKMLAQVASRLFFVEGIDDDDDRIDWVGELDVPDLYAASRAMEAIDGGVETRTKVVCDECEEEMTIDVPFGSAGFLAPTPR